MMKVIEMVRSTSMPSSAAILRSCSQARWARPSDVLLTRYQKSVSRTAVTTTMMICFSEIDDAERRCRPCETIGGIGLLRGPCVTWTKFDSAIDMPIAVISGARRNEPRSGR